MTRLPILLVLSVSCVPISSEVTTVANSLQQARLERCSDDTADGPQWCQAIEGRCYDVRIGPNQAPAEGTVPIRYDRTSACLVPCAEDGLCPLHHQCQKRMGVSGEREVCVPQGFCRSDADCVQPKYGGHLGTSHCSSEQPAICRAARENLCDSDGDCASHCDSDSECVSLLGDGAECYLQTCQTILSNSDWPCEEKATFNRRCEHAAKDVDLNSLSALERLGFVNCQDSDDCAGDRLCVALDNGLGKRCALAGRRGECKMPGKEWTSFIENESQVFCLPFIPCVPNGRSSGDDRESGKCPGMRDETCDGESAQMLVNQPPCEPGGCPEGSNCFSGVCFVPDANRAQFSDYQMGSIPGCKIVD